MNLYVQVGLFVALIASFVIAAKYLKGGKVWIHGVNISADPTNGRLKKCKVKGSAAIWKTKSEQLIIPLGEDFSYGSCFLADLSGDQGRVIRLKSPDGSCHGMPGSRLWAFVFGDGLGQVARNQGTNYQTVIMVGIAVVAVLALAALGAIIKVLQVLQDNGAV